MLNEHQVRVDNGKNKPEILININENKNIAQFE